MQEIDIALIRYGASVITEKGVLYKLGNAVISLSWEEQEGQLAQKATVGLAADCKVDGESLRSILKLNRTLRISANWGDGSQKMFEGFIWEWQYQHGQQKQLTVVAYDPMIRLQQSKDFKYFSKGMNTPAILQNICGDWGIPLDYKWGQQITHEKKVFSGEAISDMITGLLDEVRQQTNSRYITLYRDGKLEVNAYGTNKDMYVFGGKDTISTTDKLSMNSLVTRVKVIGKADDEGRASVEAVVDGNMDFGVLQEIVQRDSDKDLGKAKTEAQTILNERGKPEESIMVTAPDLPFLRKGDAVEMKAGNLKGIFYTLGVSHNATQKQMTLTLLRQPEQSADSGKAANTEQKQEDGNFQKGDAVILNGPVYRDSYGTGKGRTFTDYKSTITIVAPLERACPYHIGQIGWVYPNEITKA